MSDDPFLDELRAEWRRHPVDPARLQRQAARRRLRGQLGLVAGAVGILGYLVIAILFSREALTGGPPVFGLAAIAFTVGVPPLISEFVYAWRDARTEPEQSPEGLLDLARRRIAAARHALWGFRVAAIILAGTVAGLLLLFAIGRASAAETWRLGLCWSLTALGCWLWQMRRGQRLATEAEQCERLLAEYRAA
ncbi:hypothetical protein ACFOMD_09060 [Sphingoaurantiacus capsulatus]|uniref:Uncharacterized protein n=1 Tax=Sphingoaurantiacus capsulatus TaxID=1771310 RepID=A0ABV7XBV2_9SPHN